VSGIRRRTLSTRKSRPREFAGFGSTARADWIGAGAASLAGPGRLQLVTASAARVAISTAAGVGAVRGCS